MCHKELKGLQYKFLGVRTKELLSGSLGGVRRLENAVETRKTRTPGRSHDLCVALKASTSPLGPYFLGDDAEHTAPTTCWSLT
eukprot:4740762-Pyramimonas_sp.AAC.1